MDKATKEDFKITKAKLEEEGEQIQGIEGVLRCLRATVRERRPLYRLRSDYLMEHLHIQKSPMFGAKGERINLFFKCLSAQFEA